MSVSPSVSCASAPRADRASPPCERGGAPRRRCSVPRKKRLFEPRRIIVPHCHGSRFKLGRQAAQQMLERLITPDGVAVDPPRVLVVVAHPDDEAIGAGALLAELPDAVVAHVTDGAPRDNAVAELRGFSSR